MRLLCVTGVWLLIVAASAAQPASAQPAPPPAGLQTSLANDVATLSDKFVGLARVMAGKYDWKPGPGIRSVADVFNLIVTENKMLTGSLSGTAPQGRQASAISDPAAMQEALRSSYADLKQAIAGLSASDLSANMRFFGREMTKQSAVLLVLMDQHEHLGQSIAYARTNNVVPPWSQPAK